LDLREKVFLKHAFEIPKVIRQTQNKSFNFVTFSGVIRFIGNWQQNLQENNHQV